MWPNAVSGYYGNNPPNGPPKSKKSNRSEIAGLLTGT